MSDEKRYGVIREQGEYMEPVFLDDKDNEIITGNDSDDQETE